jgi:hypothetical protein
VLDLALVLRPAPNPRTSAPGWRLSVWLLISALLHVGSYIVADSVLRAPVLDIEFELPMDVELGTSEALSPVPAAASITDPAQRAGGDQSAAERARGELAGDGGAGDASLEQRADAGVTGPRSRDAGSRAVSLASDAGAASARLPPGAQIAMRVDMERIRKSPIAEDVRALLAAVPDWQALLEGSGIDPVEQLDRLLLATPNLQRDKLVLAGRYLGGEDVVRAAVARLAEAHGESAPWRTEGNVQVAPWANADVTKRVIALVGPAHFVIARPEDLPRVLAISTARAQRKGAPRKGQPHPADALLSMEEGEGLSVEVEGAAQFVRRARRGIPDRLRLSASERSGGRIELAGVFTYVDDERAHDAAAYWDELRALYASNTLVVLLGLADPLEDGRVEQRAREVHLTTQLSTSQARLVLGYVRELFGPAPRPGP